MGRRLIALALAFAAILSTWLITPVAATADSAREPAIVAYGDTGDHVSAPVSTSMSERGRTYDHARPQDAADRWLRCLSAHLNVSSTHTTFDYNNLAQFAPIASRSHGAEEQAASAESTDVVLTGSQVAANSGREVILDTNAVYRWREVQGMLRAGDTPVVTRTTQAELRNLAAAGRMKTPGYMGEFGVVDDVMNVNARINIRGAMRPGQPGLFGDGSIGATALARGSSLVTFDRNFAEVMRRFGVDVL